MPSWWDFCACCLDIILTKSSFRWLMLVKKFRRHNWIYIYIYIATWQDLLANWFWFCMPEGRRIRLRVMHSECLLAATVFSQLPVWTIEMHDRTSLCPAGFCNFGRCSENYGRRMWVHWIGWPPAASGVQQCSPSIKTIKCICSSGLGLQYVWRCQLCQVSIPKSISWGLVFACLGKFRWNRQRFTCVVPNSSHKKSIQMNSNESLFTVI